MEKQEPDKKAPVRTTKDKKTTEHRDQVMRQEHADKSYRAGQTAF